MTFAEDLANALCRAMPHEGGGSRLEYEEALQAAESALEPEYEYGAWFDSTDNPYGVNVCTSEQEARDVIRSWGAGTLMRRVAERKAGPWEKI